MTYIPAKSPPWKTEANPLGPPADPATATPLNAAAMADLETRVETGIEGLATNVTNGTVLPAGAKRTAVLLLALGWKGQTVDPQAALTTTFTANTGSIEGMAYAFCSGEVVTGVGVMITNTATTNTLFKVGLYDKTGARLAVSADKSSVITGGAAIYQLAFTAPYTITADDLYYLVFLATFSGTAPTMLRANVSSHIGDTQPSSYRFAVGQGSQTDLGATQSFGAGTGGIWLAWY